MLIDAVPGNSSYILFPYSGPLIGWGGFEDL